MGRLPTQIFWCGDRPSSLPKFPPMDFTIEFLNETFKMIQAVLYARFAKWIVSRRQRFHHGRKLGPGFGGGQKTSEKVSAKFPNDFS